MKLSRIAENDQDHMARPGLVTEPGLPNSGLTSAAGGMGLGGDTNAINQTAATMSGAGPAMAPANPEAVAATPAQAGMAPNMDKAEGDKSSSMVLAIPTKSTSNKLVQDLKASFAKSGMGQPAS